MTGHVSTSRVQDGLATWVRSDGVRMPVTIEKPAAIIHGERHFVVRHEYLRPTWQLAPASALEPRDA